MYSVYCWGDTVVEIRSARQPSCSSSQCSSYYKCILYTRKIIIRIVYVYSSATITIRIYCVPILPTIWWRDETFRLQKKTPSWRRSLRLSPGSSLRQFLKYIYYSHIHAPAYISLGVRIYLLYPINNYVTILYRWKKRVWPLAIPFIQYDRRTKQ